MKGSGWGREHWLSPGASNLWKATNGSQNRFKFLKLADWTGTVETVFFAQAYKWCGLAPVGLPVIAVTATVEPFGVDPVVSWKFGGPASGERSDHVG